MGCSEARSVAKILVADDNSNIQKMVGLALKDQGIDVVAVGNGEAAVRKIADLKPDLVLADVFMPVRNGYEVCRFVKEDPTLAHIPVILLVGAFDPLDEQEAQRSGADGVLKKPFVPPDPLISMVKSALARAGVPLGNAHAAEKIAEPLKRNAADILSPAASKLAELNAAKLPEAEPEPYVENFATMPEQVKIPDGTGPLAFGSLLDTPEVEDDAAFIPTKPPTEIGAKKNWDSEKEDVEEEEEEAVGSGGRGGWRPGGDLDRPSLSAATDEAVESEVKDWREAAFHGHSPAKPSKSRGWAPAVAEPELVETAGSQAVAVSTLEAVKPAETPAFSGDAWAAAMSAGVEEKIAEPKEDIHAAAVVEEKPAEEVHAKESAKESPSNGWYSAAASPWEAEAKKASQLASTWDSAEVAEPAKASVEAPADAIAETIGPQIHEEIREVVQEVVSEPTQESSHVQGEGAGHEVSNFAPTNSEVPEPLPIQPVERNVNETQEVEAYRAPESKSWENTWVAKPAEAVSQFVEAPRQEFAAAEAEETKVVDPEPEQQYVHEPSVEVEAPAQQAETPEVGTPEERAYAAEPLEEVVTSARDGVVGSGQQQPNMDELIARVLARMNPDVLQKMTREILKPVIEAIIQDEMHSKK
jgi:CheY-like chemotaxis protein